MQAAISVLWIESEDTTGIKEYLLRLGCLPFRIIYLPKIDWSCGPRKNLWGTDYPLRIFPKTQRAGFSTFKDFVEKPSQTIPNGKPYLVKIFSPPSMLIELQNLTSGTNSSKNCGGIWSVGNESSYRDKFQCSCFCSIRHGQIHPTSSNLRITERLFRTTFNGWKEYPWTLLRRMGKPEETIYLNCFSGSPPLPASNLPTKPSTGSGSKQLHSIYRRNDHSTGGQ